MTLAVTVYLPTDYPHVESESFVEQLQRRTQQEVTVTRFRRDERVPCPLAILEDR